MSRNYGRVGAALLGLLLVSARPAPGDKPLQVGQPAPDFTVYPIDGKKFSLADLRGKVVVLNLWASWCTPCKAEMPTLDLMQINGGKHGLQIIGVLTEDKVTRGQMWGVQKVLHYPLSMRFDGKYPPVRGAVPTNYIIDRKGIVRYAEARALDAQTFAELVVPLINEAP